MFDSNQLLSHIEWLQYLVISTEWRCLKVEISVCQRYREVMVLFGQKVPQVIINVNTT